MDTPEPDITPAAEPVPDLMNDFVSSLVSDEPTPASTPEQTPNPESETSDVEDMGLDKPEEAEDKPEETPKPEPEIPEAPKSRKDWDILRTSRDGHKRAAEEAKVILEAKEQDIQELTTQLEELKTKASQLPELQEKLKDFDTYEKELAVTRLEATREYKETILAPLEIIAQSAETLAKDNDTEKDKVYDMLKEPDAAEQRRAFKELTSGWDDIDRGELWNMTKDARTILDKQDSMRENAAAAAHEQKALATAREQQEKEAFRKQFITEAKNVVNSLKEKTPFIPLAEGETIDDRFTSLEAKVAEVDLDTQSPRGKAFAAATAIIYPQMVKTIQKLQEENKTLLGRVKADNSSKPQMSPSDQSRPPTTEEDFLVSMGVSQPNLSQTLTVVGQ